MHKILVLYPHPQDAEKFRPYYESRHLPLVAKLPGLLASRHTFDIRSDGGRAPFYCIFEAEFASEAAMVMAMQSPAGQAVVDDTMNFAATPATVVHYDVVR